MTTLYFPTQNDGIANRLWMQFTAYDRQSGSVRKQNYFLPAPPSLSFADSAEFNTVDVGSKGAALDAIQGGDSGLTKGSIKDIAKAVASRNETLSFGLKSVSNPNTNTSFQANGVRNFNFTFNLMAESPQDQSTILGMTQGFRRLSYAGRKDNATDFSLDYPPIWTIKFINGSDGKENRFLPKIYSSYLTTVSCNYNTDSNLTYNDFGPLSVELALTFQESRALSRGDIETMGRDSERGINEKGFASLTNTVPANYDAQEASKENERINNILDD